ncbi:MAG: AraC family transcriptional regulator [Chloroflexota bacterium]
MNSKDTTQFWRHDALGLDLMQAYFVNHAYPRHSHDHYVICMIEQGVQSFTLKGTKYYTPPSGLIFINPGVIHTGEPATENGFVLRSIYPSVELMQTAVYRLTGHQNHLPFFRDARVDDAALAYQFYQLHELLKDEPDPLVYETQFMLTMQNMIGRYADVVVEKRPCSLEPRAVYQARDYLEANYAAAISLDDLAQITSLSPYHLIRAFHAEIGMPPHAYLQDIRIRRAQRLIRQNMPLADIAYAVGFSSQSHMTRRFKKFVGITPGQYAKAILSS